MNKMPKTVTLRIDDSTYRLFARRARADSRSLSNYIETAALEHSREVSFMDDIEMKGILSDKRLMRKLKEGSKQAREGKGRFVG